MNRNRRKELGNETVDIVNRGWYEQTDGTRVDIAAAAADSVNRTRLYTPDCFDTLPVPAHFEMKSATFTIQNETTLSAASRHVTEGSHRKTLCLNFASAKNPGGGFLGGAQAQEESLARSSALYASLITQEIYYIRNRACGSAMYTDHMILSPNVPVFRNDDGQLLSEPYPLSVLTAPAVNAGAVRKNEPQNVPLIRSTMAERITKVLTIAAVNQYEHLILGAWGCGVFQNDPLEIANLFAEALTGTGTFHSRFTTVTFAVLDDTSDKHIIGSFKQCFPD